MGTKVTLDVWSLHHNPAVWEDPERFNPDRFAPGGEYEKLDSFAYLPFSHGSRQCIGMNFSLAEQRVFLLMFLRKFEVKLAPNNIHKNGLIYHDKKFVQELRARKGLVLTLVGYMAVRSLFSAIASVPPSLKHLKAVNRIKEYQYMLQGKPVDVRKQLSVVPLLREPGAGMFLSGDRGSWTIMVAEPKAVRTLLMKTSVFPKTDPDKRPEGDLIMKWLGKDNIVSANGEEWKTSQDGQSSPINFVFPWLDAYLCKVSRSRREVHDQVDFLNELFEEIIAKKRAAIRDTNVRGIADADKDLLTMMLEANEEVDPSKRLSDVEIRSDLAIFFIAGHDTTSTALTFALYHLAVNPDIQQRAREECIRVLGDAPEDIIPTADQLKELTYLNQVIQETLRLNPPATGISQRLVAEDTDLGECFIPKGAVASLDIWALHHNPKVWDDPEKWNPDRFAPGGEYENKDSFSWLPFGHGQRQCIGMQFSLAEQRVFLSMLLRKYDISLPKDSIHANGLVITPQVAVLTADNLIKFARQVQERKGLVLGLVGFLIAQRLYSAIATVPSSLKHLKATNRIKEYRYMLQGKPIDVRKRLSFLPIMSQPVCGVFLRCMDCHGNRAKGSSDIADEDKDNIVMSNGDEWKKHRKPANPAFHKSMPINLFGRLTKVFFKQIAKENNHINVNVFMQRFTLDAIGNGAFDFDFHALEKPDSNEIRAYNTIMDVIFSPINFLIPWLDKVLIKVSRGRRAVHDDVDLVNGLLGQMIAKKKQTLKEANSAGVADEDKDLLTMMLEANQEEVDKSKRLTDEELRSDLAIFFVAGHVLLIDRPDWEQAESMLRTAVELLPTTTPRTLDEIDRQYNISQFAGINSRAVSVSLQCSANPYQALQLSELGNGVLANLQLQVRSDVRDLQESHPHPARQFCDIRDQLDRPPSNFMQPNQPNPPDEAVNRRVLSDNFDRLLAKIRSLEGFEQFLLAPSEYPS
ncbi:hypothetical protein BZG36_03385 [Bifiguratus adelaidae]|uniref:Cytochrome P450 n=1 Tax=Bifiguratus adelaidae TaxID=1938954 RepID=A0A261Y0D8_9FUNG|nr:hypothetical protein BZG36_03385 [Bifiguratus adelaidae]